MLYLIIVSYICNKITLSNTVSNSFAVLKMKKKYIIINVFLSLAVLFSILFQSVHSYEHYLEQRQEQHCDHQYSKNKTEIGHSHHSIEKCEICFFNFSSFTTTDFYAVQLHKDNFITIFSKFYLEKQSSFFKGSLFRLRAPPLF